MKECDPSFFNAFTSPHWFFTFLTLVLKICVLSWEVPIAPPGSWFQSVMVLFTKEYFPTSLVFWLRFSNYDRLYLNSLAPVSYPLSLSTPFQPVYALQSAHMPAIFLRRATDSQPEPLQWWANLAALFCTRSKALIFDIPCMDPSTPSHIRWWRRKRDDDSLC